MNCKFILLLTLGCTTGDIKLTGFTGPQSGRVDVCLDGVWGSVCNAGWGRPDAAVVCRQLGYSSSGVDNRDLLCSFTLKLYLVISLEFPFVRSNSHNNQLLWNKPRPCSSPVCGMHRI